MNHWIQLLALATLMGVLAASPVFAQDTEWDDDEPSIHEFVLNFDRQLRGLGEELEGLEGALTFNFNQDFLWGDDAELRRLEREAKDLARKAREAEDADRASLETELDEKLNEIFEYKLQRQQESIAKAEERVEKLKERRSKRETARDEIIQNRKDELLGRDKYLEW